MEAKKPVITGYIRNRTTSRGRNIRLEVVGEVGDMERKFLDGFISLTAGTLAKDDREHIKYVSSLMSELTEKIIIKVKKENGLD